MALVFLLTLNISHAFLLLFILLTLSSYLLQVLTAFYSSSNETIDMYQSLE